eukprot:Em0009g669a
MGSSQPTMSVNAVQLCGSSMHHSWITCGPSSPLILNTTSSSMSLQWNAPLQPDYVITAYTLHHRVPILKSQSEMWAPPSMATVQFHTYNPSGILFYQINSHVSYPLLNGTSVQVEVAASQFVRFEVCSGDPMQPSSACD